MGILNVFYLFREIMFETVCEMTGLKSGKTRRAA